MFFFRRILLRCWQAAVDRSAAPLTRDFAESEAPIIIPVEGCVSSTRTTIFADTSAALDDSDVESCVWFDAVSVHFVPKSGRFAHLARSSSGTRVSELRQSI